MPTTFAAVLALVLAVVPGSLGVYLFARLRGDDWRQKDWQAAIQHVAFSLVGLLLYVGLARAFDWPQAVHVLPATYLNLQASTLANLVVPYGGHWALSGLAGVLASWLDRAAFRVSGRAQRRSAWDQFATSLNDRWVVASLKTGDVYLGYVAAVDVGVPAGERDIILREPARFDEGSGNYVASGYYDMYLPAAQIDSVAALIEEGDELIGPPAGQPTFQDDSHDNTGPAKIANTATAGRDQEGQRGPGASETPTKRPAT